MNPAIPDITKIIEYSAALGILILVLFIIKEIVRGMTSVRKDPGGTGFKPLDPSAWDCLNKIKELATRNDEMIRALVTTQRESLIEIRTLFQTIHDDITALKNHNHN